MRDAKKGITLIELIVAFVIVAVGGGILMLFLQKQTDLMETSSAYGSVRTRAEIALGNMADELRLATRKGAGSPPNLAIAGGTMTFYVPTDSDNDGRIVDASGGIEWDAALPVQYSYDAGTQQLNRIQGAQARVLAHHVSAVSFSDKSIDGTLNDNEVKIQLSVQETTQHQRTAAATVATVVKIRN